MAIVKITSKRHKMKLKVIPFFLSIILFCNTSYAQELHDRNTYWKKENLKGVVKSFTEVSKSLKKIADEVSGSGKEKFVFNREGNLTERSFYHYSANDLYRQWTYKYDKQGNQIEFRECNFNDLLPKKCILSKYTYESTSNKLKVIRLYESREFLQETGKYVNKKWIYNYNENCNLIKAESYRGEDDRNQVNTYTYNEKGNITENYDVYNEKEHSKISYKYNENGNILEWKYWAGYDEDLNKIITYSYDEKENIIEKNFLSYIDNTILKKYNYKYEYDKKGNWKKCIEYKNGIPINMLERTYEYFYE